MEERKHYIVGILGGIIGGMVASIPWIAMYVYGKMILSLLAIFIALGVLKGYQIAGGKADKKLPIIIVCISVFSITISTFLIIPALLMQKENIAVTINNFQVLYANQEFFHALIGDYVISLLFTFLGISGVVANVKKQVTEGTTNDIKVSFREGVGSFSGNQQENIEIYRNACIKLGAVDKEHAIEKEKILEQVDHPNAKTIFRTLKSQQIILKYKGNYYFSEKYANSLGRRFLRLYAKILLWIILVIGLFCIFIFVI